MVVKDVDSIHTAVEDIVDASSSISDIVFSLKVSASGFGMRDDLADAEWDMLAEATIVHVSPVKNHSFEIFFSSEEWYACVTMTGCEASLKIVQADEIDGMKTLPTGVEPSGALVEDKEET